MVEADPIVPPLQIELIDPPGFVHSVPRPLPPDYHCLWHAPDSAGAAELVVAVIVVVAALDGSW